MLKILLLNLFIISNIQASTNYLDDAVECPSSSKLDRYIRMPMFHDFSKAVLSNIPGINTFESEQKAYARKKFNIYYELQAPYDDTKEILFMIPGGPGESHTFIHQFMGSSIFAKIAKNFNVITMDHRGVGCSRYYGPGDYPPESMLMRQAATDIEMIRASYAVNKKINVFGYSYGSFLAQTYALLYPNNLNRLFLGGAFSAASEFVNAMKTFEQRVLIASPNMKEDYLYLKLMFPDLAFKIMKIAEGYMYDYTMTNHYLVELVKSVRKSVDELDIEQANMLIETSTYLDPPMEWMMRSIACIEIFPYKVDTTMFPMFWSMISHCTEFENKSDHFDYTMNINNITVETFLWGGVHDHVTPAVGMKKMAKLIPHNFLYIDPDLGHGINKPECFYSMMSSFFQNGISNDLEIIRASASCQDKPKLDLISN